MIHPTQSAHFYAGLDAGDSPDSGVWESTDGGEHWRVSPQTTGLRIESLAFSPGDSNLLAAGTAKGVFLSADAGATWKRISRENDGEMQDITALAFDPADPRTIYAGTPHLPWKTTDGGASWQSISTGLVDDSDIFSIRVDPARPQLVFASACSGIYRSDSGGSSWVKIKGIQGTNRRTHIIAEDPRNSETIYAGTTVGLYKSNDGGKTWQRLNSEQVNWMVFDPKDPHTLYLATEFAGILKSADSGASLKPVNAGFANHRLSQITSDGKRLYASSTYEGSYGGVFVSEDGGLEWSLRANEEALLGRNFHSLTASPGGAVIFGASEDTILKSADGGRTWSALAMPRIPPPHTSSPGASSRVSSKRSQLAKAPVGVGRRVRINALRAVAADKTVLFAATDDGLFRSASLGTTWEQVKSPGITGFSVQAVYAPASGTSHLAVKTASSLFISSDAGRTWQPAPLPDSSYYLYDLALSTGPDVAILAATSRGLLRSTDEGAHWTLITHGIPAATVESVRFNSEQKLDAFLIQYNAIYRTVDGGESWQPFSTDGLQDAAIHTLWFAPDLPRRIFALTAARGALVFDLPQAQVAKQADHAVNNSN